MYVCAHARTCTSAIRKLYLNKQIKANWYLRTSLGTDSKPQELAAFLPWWIPTSSVVPFSILLLPGQLRLPSPIPSSETAHSFNIWALLLGLALQGSRQRTNYTVTNELNYLMDAEKHSPALDFCPSLLGASLKACSFPGPCFGLTD